MNATALNTAHVDKIITAVLYEGYSLYPYRLCIKNAKRWMFGCVYPMAHPLVRDAAESSRMSTDCLIEGSPATQISIQVRFLHLLQRRVASIARNRIDAFGEDQLDDLNLDYVSAIEVDGVAYESWQEAVERRVEVLEFELAEAMSDGTVDDTVVGTVGGRGGGTGTTFHFPELHESEIIVSRTSGPHGFIVRDQSPLEGKVTCTVRPLAPGLYGLHVAIENQSPLDRSPATALQALVSTHTILAAEEGNFISSIDPPEEYRDIAAQAKHEGAWPVLVGEEGQRDMMLASPIILYDYPQVAAESAGDLFDSTEIDEILTLRLLTLSDDEKQQLRSGDDRTRQILARTENLDEEHFHKLHGAIRGLRPMAPARS